MVSPFQAEHAINISLHVFILFTFLTIFFFLFISKTSRESIHGAFGDIIDNQVAKTLSTVRQVDANLPNHNFARTMQWQSLNAIAQKISQSSQSKESAIEENNRKLVITGSVMAGVLAAITIGLYVYFAHIKQFDVHLGHILLTNLVIFAFVGLIEAFFFIKIASKYIPVTPNFVGESILNRVEGNLKLS